MKKDVAIIGGSAAGFFSGHLLARQGARVRLYEAEKGLSHANRTLIVTSQLRDLLGPLGEGAVLNEIYRFELFADGTVASFDLKRPDLIIERSKLIRDLAREAENSGVEMKFGRRFIDLEPRGTNLNFSLKRDGNEDMEETCADIIVGADGAFSKVSRAAGWPRQPTAPLMQAIVELPKDLSPNTTRIWFSPDDTPYFYWLIPESPTRGAVGVIGESGRKMRDRMLSFLKRKQMKPIEFQGARISRYSRWIPIHRRIGRGDVYLVGDAAGHVKVSTVGGTVTGLRGAMGVAEAISNGGSSRDLRALRRELNMHLMMRKILHDFEESDYAYLIGLLSGKVRRSLSVFSRDETTRLLPRILFTQPRLLLLALRFLLMGSSFPRSLDSDENSRSSG